MEVKQRTARSLFHRLSSSSSASLSSTLSEIRHITKHDPDIRHILADYGVLPILTHLLLLDSKDEDEPDQIQENAVASLLNLSISAPEALMSTPSLLPSIAHALRSSNPLLPQLAAATLFSLLSVDAYRPIIGSKSEIISSLISLLKSPTSSPRTIKDSLKALFGLALYPLNRSSLLDLGAAPALLSLLFKDRRAVGILEDATAVIAQVSGCVECVDAFRRVGGVRILARLLDEGTSERVRENAASALLNLAMSGGERAVGDIREVEIVGAAARELVERGSERARRKAEGLLRVLDTAGRGRSLSLNRSIPEFDEGVNSSATISSSFSFSSSSVGSSSY